MRLLQALAARVALWLLGRAAAAEEPADAQPARRVAPGPSDPRAQTLAALLFLAAAACATGFVVAYALEASTQVLGLTLGFALAFVAGALVLLAHRVLATEELTEDYPQPQPQEAEAVVQIVREGGDGITRKRLLLAAGGAAGCALGAAAVVPALSLGPLLDTDPLYRTPWRRGLRLVDEHNRPLRADEVEQDAFYTAFPEGARKDELGAPVVLVRLPPGRLRLPPGRDGWAPEGILAFSKVCTHAGCAIALYRSPLYEPTQPDHALVCPCHYSTFDPATGGEVVFGPAGRPLPQLPLTVAADGTLRSAGDFSGPVGPSFAGVRRRRPT